MKILFVADARSPISQNWIRYFAERGDEIYLASTFQADIGFPLAGFQFTPVAFSSLKQNQPASQNAESLSPQLRTKIRQWIGPLRIPRSARKLRAFIQKIQPDIIHALRIPYEGMLAMSALSGMTSVARNAVEAPPLITSVWGNDFTLHAPSTPLMSYYTRKTLRAVSALHADCARDIKLAQTYSWDEKKPALVTPGNGGIRAEVFYPPAAAVNEPIIINPRGFRAYIRNDMFFKAIPLVLAEYPNAKFICAAMQAQPQALQWIKELKIAHAVTLNPPVSHAAMADIFRSAQIVISPSIHDGTPNSLLEGMACGCFPIAGDLESIREWITPEQNGLLFNANDPRSIANAILLAIKNKDLRQKAAGLNQQMISARAEYKINMEKATAFYEIVNQKS